MTSLNDKFILGRLTYLFYCYWASYKQEQINLKILKNFHLDEPIDSDLDFYNPTGTDLWKELSKPSPKKVKPKLHNRKNIQRDLTKIAKEYSSRSLPQTIETMGARRKKLSAEIRNSKIIKQETLQEYYEVSEKIDKEVDFQVGRMMGDTNNKNK